MRVPIFGGELADLRAAKKRPAGRIVITGEKRIAEAIRNANKCALLIDGYAIYDFSMVYGLPVIFSMPDIPKAFRIAAQIAACNPSHFSLQYPDNPDEVVIWK